MLTTLPAPIFIAWQNDPNDPKPVITLGARSALLGHLGHIKTHDPNDPNEGSHLKTHDPNDPITGGHAGSSLRFKTVTQMTQMTQKLAGT